MPKSNRPNLTIPRVKESAPPKAPPKTKSPKPVKFYVQPESAAFAKLQEWLRGWGIDTTPQADGKAFYLDVTQPAHWNERRRRILAEWLKMHSGE